MFNSKKQIIGQLHGGGASCLNPEGSDYYGKLAQSFKHSSLPTQRLKEWLDPNDTGILEMKGRYLY